MKRVKGPIIDGKLPKGSNRKERMADVIDKLVKRGSLDVADVNKLARHGVPQKVIDLYKRTLRMKKR